jgi:enediyne biosynthesis protein E4
MRTSHVVLAFACSAGLAAPVSAQTLSFSNQTAAAGISHTYVPGTTANSEYLGGGASGDFNRDGYEDLLLLSGSSGNGADKLYINQGNGTFVESGVAWGLTAHRGLCIGVADYDGDGWLDVYVGSNGVTGSALSGVNRLYRNLGGAFQDVAVAAGAQHTASDSFGCSWGDYDIDGDIDLFVTGFNSHKNRLYRNNGDGTFTDVSTAANITGFVAGTYGFATRFADMNGDKYPELLISGDFGTSRYFRNNANGTFTNYTVQSGTGKEENGMGQTLGDYNRDGLPDWYVTSIHSSVVSPSWTGNKLYQNLGGQLFSEISAAAGVGNGGYGWGAVSVDFNHDRWLDIGETNGAQWAAEFINERSYIWLNQGNGHFTESSAATGLNHFGQGRGMLNFDYDRDGDEDVVIIANNEPVQLWRNDLSGADTHWLRVLLNTDAEPGLAQHGYGSTVRLTAAGITQSGFLYGGDNDQSASELSVHFGLGAATLIDELTVEWNDGRTTKLTDVAVDQHLTIDPRWTMLPGGVAGASGAIELNGQGTLVAGEPATISLASAPASSPGTLFIGLAALNVPFKGGIFVPAPFVSVPVLTDAGGAMSLTVPWPAGLPTGFALWFQAWFGNAGGPLGPAGSNGLKALMP